MDPAPRPFADLPRDPELGVPVPFACGTVGFGAPRDGEPPTARRLDKRRVTQCALSRVCGVCGAGLGRPIAFLGTEAERARNAFGFPPTHVDCARALQQAYGDLPHPVLGQDAPPSTWEIVTTAAFEFVRPARADDDRWPTFQPSAVLSR